MTDSQWTVGPAEAQARLDKFLASPERLGSRGRAAAALERGKVYLNGDEASLSHGAVRLVEGDTVRVWMDRPGSAKPTSSAASIRGAKNLQILYEDDVLVVIDKPSGLLAVPLERREDAPSVYELLTDHLRARKRRPFVVHRIDRDTSGLVVFTKDATDAAAAARAVQAARARARLSGGRLRTSAIRPKAPGWIGWSGIRAR